MGAPSRQQASVPVSPVDPFARDFLVDPYPHYEALRDAGPVVWLECYGVWGMARHEDVQRTLNDPETFCSSRGVGISDFAKEKPWRPPSIVLEKDPPEHTRARAVIGRVLSFGAMKALRDGFAAAAAKKADELLARGRFDAIPELAESFPLTVFPDAVGLRLEGREHLLPYGGTVFNAFGPDNELRRTAVERAAPHTAWVMESCQRENLAPGSLGAKIHEAANTGEISAQEAAMLVRSVLSAGLDTTVISFGAAIYCLATNPDQWARLSADPSLARAAFEEAIRLESPFQDFFRTTTRRVGIGDTELGEGEKILLFVASANRDPRRWARPDSYDITRRASGHLGFGVGIHNCVGQFLARLEGEVMLEALAHRVKTIALDGEPERSFNNTLRGFARLPICIEPN